MNIVDLILVLILLYFLLIGLYRGAIKQLLDLLTLAIAIFAAFLFYQPLGSLVAKAVPALPKNFANVVGFFLIWMIVELLYYVLYLAFYKKIPENITESKLNHFLGVLPAAAKAFITAFVLLGLTLILPIPQNWRDLIDKSYLARPLVSVSPTLEKYIGTISGDSLTAIKEFLTIKPESTETIDLGFKTTTVEVDPASEQKMLELINAERKKNNLEPLVMDDSLREVARDHGRDMFARGYFSHNEPEGLTPFDRMKAADIKYITAGENLAWAPNVDVAHLGLMKSEEHRENILMPKYHKIGIGVIDGGAYGKMFCQEFTD